MSLFSFTFNQIISTIYSVTRNVYGDSTQTEVYSDVPCRWQEKQETIVDKDKKILEVTASAWIDSGYTIKYDYEVVKDSEMYKVVGIEKRYDIEGNIDHIKLYLV